MAKAPSIKRAILPVVMYNNVVNEPVRFTVESENPGIKNFMPPLISPDFFRLVGLYSFETVTDAGNRYRMTLNARALFNYWHDFCGGIQFYSPQVFVMRDEDGWNGRNPWVCTDVHTRDLQQNTRDWDLGFRVLPSLNTIFGKESVEEEEAEELGWRSIAAALMSASLGARRRFMTGVDRVNRDSNLERLVRTMQAITEKGTPFPDNPYTYYGSIDDRLKDDCSIGCHTPFGQRTAELEVVTAESTNWNSGRPCSVFTVILNPDDDDEPHGSEDTQFECESCGYEWHDEYDMGEECPDCGSCEVTRAPRKDNPLYKSAVMRDEFKKMERTTYARYLPRQLWRNG